jgi:hypothetical protein
MDPFPMLAADECSTPPGTIGGDVVLHKPNGATMGSARGNRPGRIWSLWDMKDMPLDSMLSAVRVLTRWSTKGADAEKELSSDLKVDQEEKIATFEDPLRDFGFIASAASIKKIMAILSKQTVTWADLIPPASECLGRLIDESKDMEFFALLPRKSDYFKKPMRGWESAIDRFPNIRDEIEEASKCYALSRYAAAVFHSVQIVEHGLVELGVFINVGDPKSGWTAVSKALDTIIQKPHKSRSRFEKKNFEFLEQTQGTVQGLKNAWRNKISHSQGRLVLMTTEFGSEIAEEILFATRAFTRRLAEGIPAPKKKPKKKGA